MTDDNKPVRGNYNPDTGKIEYEIVGRDLTPHVWESEAERRKWYAEEFLKRRKSVLVQSSTGKK